MFVAALVGYHLLCRAFTQRMQIGAELPGSIKLRFLNALRAAEFGAIEALLAVRGGTSYPEVRAGIHEDSDEIVRMAIKLVRKGG